MPRGTRARGAHGGGISRDCAGSSLEWEHGDPGKVPPLVLRVGTGSLSLGTAAVLGMADLFSASSVPLLEVLLEGLMLCM